MMLNTDRTEEVYEFIWKYVTEHEALPATEQIADAVKLTKADVGQPIKTDGRNSLSSVCVLRMR
jgi:hypothetical protein